MGISSVICRVWGAALFSALALATASAQTGADPYTTHTRYDDARRAVGTIAPDPDGAGPLGFPATRTTYNALGHVEWVETGELSAWQAPSILPANWSGFTVFNKAKTEYDEWGRAVTQLTYGGSTIEAATQTSYDGFGRAVCSVQRMNKATFGALPSDACALGTPGSFGADRVTRTNYDEYSRVTSLERAVGTALQQTYQAYTYTDAHKPDSVTDAKGNRTEYQYDTFNRLKKTIFPSKTSVGTANTSDYEQYGYDDIGNLTSLRKRDGRTINYAYDALNRMSSKDIPNSTTLDVYYDYDLQGLQLSARYGSASGTGIINTFDGFGRLESSNNQFLSQQLGYDYDRNGNRTKLTYPGGVEVNYARDGLDRVTGLDLNGTQSLVSGTYSQRGHLEAMSRHGGSGAGTSITVDDVGRLDTFGHDFYQTGADLTGTFGYSPASQVTQKDFSNAIFEHQTGYTGTEGSYAVNGLNQYTSVAGQSLSYDDNGNLTSDGSRTYGYDVENRLIAIGGADVATLSYDPLGRLYETVVNGVTTRFLYDGDALVAEYDGSNALLRRYVHGSGVDQPLAWLEGAGSDDIRYYHANHQGSIIAISDDQARVDFYTSYSPYGVPSNLMPGRFTYTGQILLPGLDLYHYKARVYHPVLGRFLQTDPIGYQDQMNMYAYVGNDPMNATDPSGMVTLIIFNNEVSKSGKVDSQHVALIVSHSGLSEFAGSVDGVGGPAIYDPNGDRRWGDPRFGPVDRNGDSVLSQSWDNPDIFTGSAATLQTYVETNLDNYDNLDGFTVFQFNTTAEQEAQIISNALGNPVSSTAGCACACSVRKASSDVGTVPKIGGSLNPFPNRLRNQLEKSDADSFSISREQVEDQSE